MTIEIVWAIWIAIGVLALVAAIFLVAVLVPPYLFHDLERLARGRGAKS